MLPIDLLGAWRLDRTVEDRRTGERLRVHGALVLTAEGADIGWQEDGSMTGPRGRAAVRRTLKVTREPDGWMVRFADGREFHPWHVGVDVVHECAPDRYRGRIDGTPDAWTVVWEARGPAKDYRIETNLVPASFQPTCSTGSTSPSPMS